jgi:hypothetical protein
MKAAMKIAGSMTKEAFGEGESDGKSLSWWKKATVAEELAENDERKQKWQRMEKAYDVWYAFTDAYFDDATPVADFEKLLDEAVLLMKGTESKGMVSKILKNLVGKAGATLSAATKEKLSEAHKHLKAATTVIEDLHGALGDGSGEEKSADDDQIVQTPATKRSRPAKGATGGKDELEAHLHAREILRGITTAATAGLEEINSRVRDITKKPR